jgi:curved DNA-binding protein CbpA
VRVRSERDYYAILGVAVTATDEEIKRAYRKLALQSHPDRNPGDRRAEEGFKRISEAYAVLMDSTRRRDYDSLRRARAEGARPREPRWRDDDLYRDLFTDPRSASVFEDLAREWARMGFRADDAFLRGVFFQGRAVLVVGPDGIRWVGPFGGRAPAERVNEGGPGTTAGADAVPSIPGFLGWLWGQARDALRAPVRKLGGLVRPPSVTSRRGDLSYEVALRPEDLRAGGRYRVTIRRPGRSEDLLVKVPPGLRAGTHLRLRGKGEPGADGRPGDLFLIVRAKA